jgi:hypothetical protein
VLGVKIAERLLTEMCPATRKTTGTKEGGVLSLGDERIRIVLACRSINKAEQAVMKLRKLFPSRSILVDIEQLDLCQMCNVELFCQRFLQRY